MKLPSSWLQLAKVAELVGYHGFKLTDVDAGVHQSQSHLQVLTHRQEHAPEAGMIEYAGIHIRREEDLFREGAYWYLL